MRCVICFKAWDHKHQRVEGVIRITHFMGATIFSLWLDVFIQNQRWPCCSLWREVLGCTWHASVLEPQCCCEKSRWNSWELAPLWLSRRVKCRKYSFTISYTAVWMGTKLLFHFFTYSIISNQWRQNQEVLTCSWVIWQKSCEHCFKSHFKSYLFPVYLLLWGNETSSALL